MSTEISISDAAKLLCLSPQRVRELCRSGKLKARKLSGAWLVDKFELERFGLRTAANVAEDRPAYSPHSNKDRDKLIALSFFSGAMGLDIGLERAGFNIRLACELDKYCRQTITLNKPEIALLGDISEHSADDIRSAAGLSDADDIDLIAGGPPCQAFSTAGRRKAFSDNRGNVFIKFVELSMELKPKYLVIENVRGLLSCPLSRPRSSSTSYDGGDLNEEEIRGSALNFLLDIITREGYDYSFNLYNSANFGTPQTRERVVIICSRDGGKPPYLIPTHSEEREAGLKKWRTLRSAIKNIPRHDHLNFPEKRLKYYRMLGPGENWRNLPPDEQKAAMGKSYYSGGGKTGFFRRLAWNKPAPTLVTQPTMPATDLAHPEENRPLSIQEYKRLQDFPDSWEIAGPLIQQYRQVGNAVPVNLGKAIGLLLNNLIRGHSVASFPAFKYSRYSDTCDVSWHKAFDRLRRETGMHKRTADLF